MSWITSHEDGVCISVKVTPRASRNAMGGVQGDMLKIKLTAPPVEGKANAALVDFLAERLHLPRAHIRILQGATGRIKRVEIRGLSEDRVRVLLRADE